MATSCYVYANFNLFTQQNLINDLADNTNTTIKAALVTDTYTPFQNRHNCWSAPAWTSGTSYEVGDLVKPTTPNGHIYECISAGTSDSSEPTWPTTDGNTVTDNTVTWECIEDGDINYHEVSGTGYTAGGQEISNKTLEQSAGDTVFDGDNVLWGSSTITARYLIVYDDIPTADEDKKLLAYLDFGENKSTSSADFEVQWNADGIFETTPTQAP